jgi:hypothetical protein
MFDQLIQMLQQQGQESVVNNAAVPNEHNNGVLQEASTSITNVLKDMVDNGQGDPIAAVANDPNHPAVQQMQSNFIDNIVQKFGINGAAAKGIAASLIPSVLSAFNSGGSKDASDIGGGFNLDSITTALGKMRLDKDGDGKFGLGDITKMFGA